MLKFSKRVKRASQINKVSSRTKAIEYLRILLLAAFIFSCCAFETSRVSASDITIQKVIELANKDRSEKGVEMLTENLKLAEAAEFKAGDMISNDYFSHNSPEGKTPWNWVEKAGYDYNYAGENLAMDFKSSEKMNEAWMASPTHRANILNEKYKDIGVAVKDGIINGHLTTIVVQLFGSGDKNAKTIDEQNPKIEATAEVAVKETSLKGNVLPDLPTSGRKLVAQGRVASQPIITSPSERQSVPQGVVDIVGRAAANSEIRILERGSVVGRTAADEYGWFKVRAAGLSEGEHSFEIQNDQQRGNKVLSVDGGRATTFRIDGKAPVARYKLFAFDQEENEYLLKATADESGCVFSLGRESYYAGSSNRAVFMVSKDHFSSRLAVEDPAGNRTYEEINIFNLHNELSDEGTVNMFAEAFSTGNIFSAYTGNNYLAQSLNIFPRQLGSLQLANK